MFIVTNNAKSVYAALEKIAATPGTLDKQEMVKIGLTNSAMFKRVCEAAYNPFVTYGMARVPARAEGVAAGTNTLDEDWPWQVLKDMASRKLTGSAAHAEVQKLMNFLTPESAELLRRIILRDLRAGFTDGTINKAVPKTLPSFPYMRCSLPHSSNMNDWDWNVGIVVQEKADGMFANVTRDAAGQSWVTSRQGTPIPLDGLGLRAAVEASFKPGTQTHGELTVYEGERLLPREDGNGILNSVAQGGELPAGHTVRFDAWDQVPLDAVAPKGKYAVRYRERLRGLVEQVIAGNNPSVRVIPTRIVKNKAEAYAYYRELLKQGKEGVICKHPDTVWKDGTSKDQVKLKLEFEVDLVVVDFVPGTPGTKTESTFGSLLTRSSDAQLEVAVSGFTDAMRQKLHSEREETIGKIITVRANSIMHAEKEGDMHSLFLPRFIELRSDKEEADSFARVQQQMQAALEAA